MERVRVAIKLKGELSRWKHAEGCRFHDHPDSPMSCTCGLTQVIQAARYVADQDREHVTRITNLESDLATLKSAAREYANTRSPESAAALEALIAEGGRLDRSEYDTHVNDDGSVCLTHHLTLCCVTVHGRSEEENFEQAREELEQRVAVIQSRERHATKLEAQRPHWGLVSEGWPEVEGEYLTLSRGKAWHDPDPQVVEYSDDDIDRGEWTEMGITDYVLLEDLLKLPGGPGEEAVAPSDPTPEPDEQRRCSKEGPGNCVFAAGHGGPCCPF